MNPGARILYLVWTAVGVVWMGSGLAYLFLWWIAPTYTAVFGVDASLLLGVVLFTVGVGLSLYFGYRTIETA